MSNLRNKIAICHQTFAAGDAIGNDIAGMYRLLDAMGFEPVVLCEHNPQGLNHYRISHCFNAKDVRRYSLIIYHHSQYWEEGEKLIEACDVPLVFKFHNITPARYFKPYATCQADACQKGEEMTRRLTQLGKPHQWLSDSEFNRQQLVAAGIALDSITVVPPFNRSDNLIKHHNEAVYGASMVDILFVGRFVPNKGHLHLLHVVKALVSNFPLAVRLLIAGARPPELNGYYQGFVDLTCQLGLQSSVRVLPYLPEQDLDNLFKHSHVYLCCSEHEGFCVPIIEAQAVGLPVIGTGAGGKSETAGPQQLISNVPATAEDYLFYARLIFSVCSDAALRAQIVKQGYSNVFNRFTTETIENRLIGAILPLLKALA